MEEQAGYPAPSFRFRNEGGNAKIPLREASETPVDSELLVEIMKEEFVDGYQQIESIKKIISELKEFAYQTLEK